jgi:hypothetical protein
MGAGPSSPREEPRSSTLPHTSTQKFRAIKYARLFGQVGTSFISLKGATCNRDNYRTVEDVQDALRQQGLESSQLIIAVDFTKVLSFPNDATPAARTDPASQPEQRMDRQALLRQPQPAQHREHPQPIRGSNHRYRQDSAVL